MTKYISKNRKCHLNVVSIVNQHSSPRKRLDRIEYMLDVVIISKDMKTSLETGEFDMEFAIILN